MFQKKGQFYLLAVIILVGISVGIIVVSNYVKEESSSRVYDISKELEIESEKVLDFDAINQEEKIEEFTKNFSFYVGSDFKIIYIVGKEGSIEVYSYEEGIKTFLDPGNIDETIAGEISVNSEGVWYNFKLNPGTNFHFIISQEIGEEKHVATK